MQIMRFGDVLYLNSQLPYDNDAYVKLTLTSVATKVGAGDVAYLWMRAKFEKVGNPTSSEGWWRLSEELPSSLDAQLDYKTIVNPPWLDVDGSNATAETIKAIQGSNEKEFLTGAYNHSSNSAVGNISVSSNTGNPLIIYYKNADLDTLNKAFVIRSWVRIASSQANLKSKANRYSVQITGNISHVTAGVNNYFTGDTERAKSEGAFDGDLLAMPAGNVYVEIAGNDTHRGEFSEVAFTGDYDDLTDKPTTISQAQTNKLNGIEAGAEVNVKSDWNEANSSSDAFIDNKPTIPSAPSLIASKSNVDSSFSDISSHDYNGGDLLVITTIDYKDNQNRMRSVTLTFSEITTTAMWLLNVSSQGEGGRRIDIRKNIIDCKHADKVLLVLATRFWYTNSTRDCCKKLKTS